MTLITCDADLDMGIEALSRLDPRWTALAVANGRPPLRRREGGFTGLVAIIVAQQLSVASARAVWARVETVLAPLTPDRIGSASDEEMRLAGLSRPKQRALRALAAALRDGTLDLDRLTDASADAIHAALTAVPGIGPWTADIYILFCLGHRDGFAAGDLALQEAARQLLSLPTRPKAAELAGLAEAWRPWRGVAARLLWAHYAALKAREGVLSPGSSAAPPAPPPAAGPDRSSA